MQFTKFLFLVSNFIILIQSRTKFTKLDYCTTSNETIEFLQCYLSDEGQFNVTFEFLKKVEKIYFLADIFSLIDNNFVEIFKLPKIEWCSIANNKRHIKGLIKLHLEPIKKEYPKIFKCPLTGIVNLSTTPNYEHLELFHSGTYRVIFKAHDDDDENVASISFVFEIIE
ncbi:hypothetical protein PVAND_017637 [Polypedilum vanderplanki]|uniref:MD-2-related lipid-recognition domain-containing protein n=1 Tax=Polypedilum vanderplanki TaxID=319348 RepID=A0A9J6B9E3_POLVA|nr:hypothetical protein PVAND_017637 [Polypedilum vanderplanki]